MEDLAREHELPEPVLGLMLEVLQGDAAAEVRVEEIEKVEEVEDVAQVRFEKVAGQATWRLRLPV